MDGSINDLKVPLIPRDLDNVSSPLIINNYLLLVFHFFS